MFEFFDERTYATVGEHGLIDVELSDYPHHQTDSKTNTDESWNYKDFKKKFQVSIVEKNKNFLEFDLIGIDCSIANSFRRIMLSEVPTIAIEKVHFYLNTSVFQEEFLAHRLGLIPIKANTSFFEFPANENDLEGNPEDTIIFELKAKCTKNYDPPKNSVLPKDLFVNRNIYTSHLKWIPIGNQEEIFKNDPPKPVHDDILIAKLSEGQEIDLKLHCHKGIGRDHAKFSPVCTASYKLHPYIRILKEIQGEDAHLLQSCFSKGVIEIAPNGIAFVKNERLDSTSRNVFLYPKLKNKVKLGLKKNHFIFNVESTGTMNPDEIFIKSIDELMNKFQKSLDEMNKLEKSFEENMAVDS